MQTYKPMDRVGILNYYTGHMTFGTVARISSTGKRVWVTLDAKHIIRDVAYSWHPSTGHHSNEWHGILQPLPVQGQGGGV